MDDIFSRLIALGYYVIAHGYLLVSMESQILSVNTIYNKILNLRTSLNKQMVSLELKDITGQGGMGDIL